MARFAGQGRRGHRRRRRHRRRDLPPVRRAKAPRSPCSTSISKPRRRSPPTSAAGGGAPRPSPATSPTAPTSMPRSPRPRPGSARSTCSSTTPAGTCSARSSRPSRPQWDKLIAINLTGALHMHHAVLPGMVARKARPHRQHRLRRRARRLVRRGGLRRLQGRPRRLLQDDRARACAARDHRQRRLPRPDRHGAVRRLQGRRRQSGKAGRGLHPLDPARPHRPARRPAGRDPVLRQRRRRLRHRPGAQRLRRPDDGRLIESARGGTPCSSRTSSTRSATASPGSSSTARTR